MSSFFEFTTSLLGGIALLMQSSLLGALPATHIGTTGVKDDPVTVLFVGDVMLGRYVESTMEARGYAYPFSDARNIVSAYDLALANFEGAVPEVHQKTENFDMRFSVRKEFLGVIRDIGFDALSLANNHAYDYGLVGYTHTQTACEEYRILCRGNPYEVNEYSTGVFSVADVTIGVVFVHTTFGVASNEVTREVESLSRSTDVQFVYVHWGNEYEFTHSEEQENFAHEWVDAGADAIVGHHPHVVQDVEMYNKKPIFYSLGNFIFDQYFNEDVGVGLGVGVTITKGRLTYNLIPFESISNKSQPRAVDNVHRQAILERILKNLDHLSVDERASGVLTVEI